MRFSLVILCIYVCIATAEEFYFKHSAGEASEFGSFILPTPTMSAQMENSAAYFIQYSAASGNRVKATQSIYVDSTTQFDFTVFTPILDSISVTLTGPNGKSIPIGKNSAATYFPIGDDKVPGTFYALNNPAVGQYQISIMSNKLDKATYNRLLTNTEADGYLLVTNDDSIHSHTSLLTYQLFTGNQVGVVTLATADSFSAEDIKSGKVPKALDTTDSARMVIVFPNGTRVGEQMHDDGLHSDGVANDGIFAATVTAPVAGDYIIQATVSGTTSEGVQFVRTTEQVVPVIDRLVTLAGTAIGVMESSGNRMIVNIATNAGSLIEQYRAYAEVWGKDANGNDIPVCWIGGMTVAQQAEDGSVVVPLELDLNWVSRVNAQEPFTLKNVIVQDPITFIPYDQAAEIPLKAAGNMPAIMASFSGLLTSTNQPISEEMRMGRRPAKYALALNANATADSCSLLLIHGYCVEINPWSAVQSQFTNSKIFLKSKANYANDEFAKAVIAFGGEGCWSYIGHSQGGLVGVHIANAYWSGLDQISGGRLVQSVGSPYKGSGAAGVAANLGKVFGAGCGACKDLTKDGAALWLATIADHAKIKAYYYTTTADSCNFATGFVLQKPNDGIAEKEWSQLAGANSMGNTEKFCHSVNMKWPAQTQDATRNAEMNSLTARTPINKFL